MGLRLWRVIKRCARYFGQTRPALPEGCCEGFNRETLPFWHFIWRTRVTARQRILALVATALPHLSVVHLKSPDEVRAFLAAIARG